jgi:hypothetical protein
MRGLLVWAGATAAKAKANVSGEIAQRTLLKVIDGASGERTWKPHAIQAPNSDLNKSINYDSPAEGSRKLLHIQRMESGDIFPPETVFLTALRRLT